MHEGERPITLDANVRTCWCYRLQHHVHRRTRPKAEGYNVCMRMQVNTYTYSRTQPYLFDDLTSMVLQCSVHALQLTAPQHTAVALVNFCNAVLAARASLKRFTLEFVHALDYTNWIKPIFWSESNGKWSVKLKRDSFTTRSMEKSLTLSRHLQRVNSMHFAWYVDGISRSCTAAVMTLWYTENQNFTSKMFNVKPLHRK